MTLRAGAREPAAPSRGVCGTPTEGVTSITESPNHVLVGLDLHHVVTSYYYHHLPFGKRGTGGH